MINFEKKIKNFFRYKILTSKISYYLYVLIISVLNFKILLKKLKYFIDQGKNEHQNCKDVIILKNNGYHSLTDVKFIEQANFTADYILNRSEKKTLRSENKNKAFDKILQTEDLLTDEKVFNFVTNDYLISVIESYLENKPQILHCHVWYSYNDKDLNNSSQDFHLDYEDRKQIKLFLFLNDVTKDNGPTIAVNKYKSQRIIKKNNYKLSYGRPARLTDELVNIEKADCLTGKKGQVYLIDTSSVLHCGSRKSTGVRKVLMAQYVSPYFTTENKDINNENFLALLKKNKDFEKKSYLFDSIFLK